MAAPKSTSHLAAAVEAARSGFPVFPLRPRAKTPLRRGWQRAATSDLDSVEQTWNEHPDANIGIRCGGGLMVIEADSTAGEAALRERGLPATTTVRTARGTHYYLRGQSGNRTGILPDVDVRGSGGFVVGAGSIHPSGTRYSWVIPPWEVPPAQVPEDVEELLRSRRGGKGALVGSSGTGVVPPDELSVRVIPKGRRNTTLHRIASSFRGRYGLTADELLPTILAINDQRCKPPLSPDEVQGIVSSAASYDVAPPWFVDPYGFASDPRLSSTERHLLLGLGRYANAAGECFPGVRRLHAETGINRNAIQRSINGLVAARRITVERGGRGRPNRYRLLV
jgi:Bifunctional DNA primase/polymerase, N-terminal/Primase C terminal 1 (PriCT-1)/Helix-turn-helix domain